MKYRAALCSISFSFLICPAFADWQNYDIAVKAPLYKSFNSRVALLDPYRNLSVLWASDSDFRQSRFEQRYIGKPYAWSEGPLGNADAQGLTRVAMGKTGDIYAIWETHGGLTANYFTPDYGWHQDQVIKSLNNESKIDFSNNRNHDGVIVWAVSSGNENQEHRIKTTRYSATGGWEPITEITRSPFNTSDVIYPKVSMNSSGQAIAAWEERQYNKDKQKYVGQIWVSLYNPASQLWSAPLMTRDGLEYLPGLTQPLKVVIDREGNAFLFYNNYVQHYCSACAADQVWTEKQLANRGVNNAPPEFNFAVDGNRNVTVIWREDTIVSLNPAQQFTRLYANRFDATKSTWDITPTRLDVVDNANVDAGGEADPQLLVLGNGNALVAFNQKHDVVVDKSVQKLNAIWTAKYRNGSWFNSGVNSTAEVLDTDPVWAIKLARASDDSALAVWGRVIPFADKLYQILTATRLTSRLDQIDVLRDIYTGEDGKNGLMGRGIQSSNPDVSISSGVADGQDDFVVYVRDTFPEAAAAGGTATRDELVNVVYQGNYAAPAKVSCNSAAAKFSLGDVVGANPSTDQFATTVVIGMDDNCLTPISLDRGSYSINDQAFMIAPAYVKKGDKVIVKLQSSGDYAKSITATLTIADQAAPFTVFNKLHASDEGGDDSPDPFNIVPISGVLPLSEQVSPDISITGINKTTAVSVVNGEYQIGSGSWQSTPGFITPSNGNSPAIKVRVSASEKYLTTTTATLLVGDKSADFQVTTLAKTAFSAASPQVPVNYDGVPLNSLVTGPDSYWVVKGLPDAGGVLYPQNGKISVNGNEFMASATPVKNDDQIRASQVSAADYSKRTVTQIMLGDLVWAKLTSQTYASDASIDDPHFDFKQKVDLEPSSTVTSYVITIQGINTTVPISVKNGTYSINNGSYTDKPGTVSNGDQVKVQVVLPNSVSLSVVATISIGGLDESVELKTRAANDSTTANPSDPNQNTPPNAGVTDNNARSAAGSNPLSGGGGGGGGLTFGFSFFLVALFSRRRSLKR